jgi:hypothetical protein
MDLDEVIKQLEDPRVDCITFQNSELTAWLRELRDLREENKVLISECDRLIKEKGELLKKSEQIAEYKRLLKAAVEDIRHCMHSYDPCEVCSLLGEDGECPATDDDDCKEKYKWRYEDEALKLIGGSENG